MDEPCSALDPIATLKIEELIDELKQRVHDRHRHAQHAAGGARRRHDRVFMLAASWSSTRRRTRSSRTPTTAGPRSTSPGSSASTAVAIRDCGPHVHFQEELPALEEPALGALDLVVEQLDRALEALEHQDVELAEMVVARRRPPRRPLPRGPPGHPVAAGAAGARGGRPAARRRAAARDQARRAHGRPVREHRQAHPDHGPRAAGRRRDARARSCAWAARRARRSCSASRRSPLRDVALAEDLVRQDARSTGLNREVFQRAIDIGDDPDTREWAMT